MFPPRAYLAPFLQSAVQIAGQLSSLSFYPVLQVLEITFLPIALALNLLDYRLVQELALLADFPRR